MSDTIGIDISAKGITMSEEMQGPIGSGRAVSRSLKAAPMPVNYERAKQALAECEQIDECKEWADTAAAMASYAEQRSDKTMLHTAQRIIVRAKVRIGEILAATPRAYSITHSRGPGKLTVEKNPNSRASLAEAAGISSQSAHQMIRMARVPKEQREAAIERTPPITATDLRLMALPLPKVGNKFTAGAAYRKFVDGTRIYGFAAWAINNDPRQLGVDLSEDEADRVRPAVRQLIEWLDNLDRALAKKVPQ